MTRAGWQAGLLRVWAWVGKFQPSTTLTPSEGWPSPLQVSLFASGCARADYQDRSPLTLLLPSMEPSRRVASLTPTRQITISSSPRPSTFFNPQLLVKSPSSRPSTTNFHRLRLHLLRCHHPQSHVTTLQVATVLLRLCTCPQVVLKSSSSPSIPRARSRGIASRCQRYLSMLSAHRSSQSSARLHIPLK
jgi:hypothetical protein